MVSKLPDFSVFKTPDFFESGQSFPGKNPRQIFGSMPLIRVNFKKKQTLVNLHISFLNVKTGQHTQKSNLILIGLLFLI